MPHLESTPARRGGPPTSNSHRKILAVGFTHDEFHKWAPLLKRSSFELDRFHDPAGALELLGPVPFHMLMVRYPLPSMSMDDFLAKIRHPMTRSSKSSLVILADHAHFGEAQNFVLKGANRVIELEPTATHIESIVADLLHIAPRRSARFMARIQARLDGAPRSVLGVIRNTSATGLLMETDQMLRRGTEVAFELTLPGGRLPVRGRAEVVRHTTLEKEKVRGLGMRILSFNGGSGEEYSAFIRRQMH